MTATTEERGDAPSVGDAIAADVLVFDEMLSGIMTGYKDFDRDTQRQVADGLSKVYTDCKHLAALSELTKNAIATDQHYRRFFFFPDFHDMAHYVALFSSTDEKLVKVKFSASCVFFLCHHKDKKLLRRFVLDGGLIAVARNFEEANMWSRSQYFEILFSILGLSAEGSTEPSSLWWPDGPHGEKVRFFSVSTFKVKMSHWFLKL